MIDYIVVTETGETVGKYRRNYVREHDEIENRLGVSVETKVVDDVSNVEIDYWWHEQ